MVLLHHVNLKRLLYKKTNYNTMEHYASSAKELPGKRIKSIIFSKLYLTNRIP